MLDSDTKKRIDDLRNILVAKLPIPQSQVEHITTGLIYKFMHDVDEEAVEMGGVPLFFTGEFEKYAWNNLFNPKLGGAEKVKLYSDAIEKMYSNPNAPSFFREIFKNADPPLKVPEIINPFLKEINEFHYSHSEKLGDAYEYLLSFMGSQGKAGQFRTPRHIIDFIVEIVNPQKNETILDPACGTAGFLISSYKHILEQNTDKNLKRNTDKRLGNKLTARERRQVVDNLMGYDISPDMVRISLVNMYLHNFKDPKIYEYDTLSSEDRWNEYYDVILANPPFFSPKGGIPPHSRFGVQSKRAEVLFVDYIMEHLKTNGRAGIIVPEGIIFQTGTAYKILRKKLVEDCLVGVISLPAGVFNPYSPVKTSVLILDKELNQKLDSIFFAKVENDGFSLGAQRTPIDKNNLPFVLQEISRFLCNEETSLLTVKKENIEKSGYKLTRGQYESNTVIQSSFDTVDLREVIISKPVYGSGAKKAPFDGKVRYLRITDITDDGRLKEHDLVSPSLIEEQYFLNSEDFLIARSGSVGRTYLHVSSGIKCQFAGYLIKFLLDKDKVIPKYLFYLTKSNEYLNWINRYKKDGTISNINAQEYLSFTFPLPPIEIQQEIVEELEGYQKIIDGCRQVVETYKPTIDIDPSWEMVELGDFVDLLNGYAFKPSDYVESSKVMNFRMSQIRPGGFVDLEHNPKFLPDHYAEEYKKFLLQEGDVVIAMTDMASDPKILGVPTIVEKSDFTLMLNQRVGKFFGLDTTKVSYDYLGWILKSDFVRDFYKRLGSGGVQINIGKSQILSIKIPLPSLQEQQKIVENCENVASLVNSNKKLIEIYTQKIQDRVNKVWGKS